MFTNQCKHQRPECFSIAVRVDMTQVLLEVNAKRIAICYVPDVDYFVSHQRRTLCSMLLTHGLYFDSHVYVFRHCAQMYGDVTTLWCRPGSLLGGVLLFAPRITDDIKRFPDGILPIELFPLRALCFGSLHRRRNARCRCS